MAVGRVAVKGAARWLWAEKLTRGQSVCSATVRHAGMCPAAAAELEHEYRPGHCSAASRLCYHFIWLGWRQEPRTRRLIIPTYGC